MPATSSVSLQTMHGRPGKYAAEAGCGWADAHPTPGANSWEVYQDELVQYPATAVTTRRKKPLTIAGKIACGRSELVVMLYGTVIARKSSAGADRRTHLAG
jgi:hypothetical protein